MDQPRGIAKIRTIHATTLARNVDIDVSTDASPSQGDILLSNILYMGDSGSLSPGMAYLIITTAGDAHAVAVGPY